MTKTTRVPVPLTDEELTDIRADMAKIGIRAMSDYLRIAALDKARAGK